MQTVILCATILIYYILHKVNATIALSAIIIIITAVYRYQYLHLFIIIIYYVNIFNGLME